MFFQYGKGGVVENVAARVDDPVLAMAGVGVQRHVAHDTEFGKFFFEPRNHARDQTFRVGGFLAVQRFQLGVDYGEQRQHRHLELETALGHRQQLVQSHALYTRHGGDRLGLPRALHDEYRINEVIGSEHMLSHQAPREVVAPHAAHTHAGEVAVDIHDCL